MRSNIPVTAEKPFKIPENLSDANQDGKVDEGDFIRGFSNLVFLLIKATHILGDKADFFYGRF